MGSIQKCTQEFCILLLFLQVCWILIEKGTSVNHILQLVKGLEKIMLADSKAQEDNIST